MTKRTNPKDINMCFMGKFLLWFISNCRTQSLFFYSVLVHSGDLSGGHYFAFVKPEKDGKW